jgi:hypothetical protein
MTGRPAWTVAVRVPTRNDLVGELARLAARGVRHVALDALADRPAEHLDALADCGLFVACARLRGDLTLPAVSDRRAELARLRLQVADAARLGATLAWLTAEGPGSAEASASFREGVALLAAHAAGRMVRLAVRPWPDLADVGEAGEASDLDGLRRAGPRLWLVEAPEEGLSAAADVLAGVGFAGTVVAGTP